MTSTEELGQEIASLSAHIDAVIHRTLECIRRFDEADGWHEQGAISCAHWLSWRVGWDPGTAREKVRVARAVGKLPAIEEAFGSAVISYAKVRALTRVATPENERRLLEMVLVATAAQLERLCRSYRAARASQRVPEPEDQVADGSAETRRPSRADGVVRLAESFLAGHRAKGSGGERFQLMVHLEQEALVADGQWAATLEDGTGVSAETLRRVACDCGLLATGGGGETRVDNPVLGIMKSIFSAATRRNHEKVEQVLLAVAVG